MGDGDDVAVFVSADVDAARPAGDEPDVTDDVTVVVTCHNQAPYILEAVASALAQQPQPSVVVIDDGSTDDSVARLGSVSDRITVISTPNRGVAAARNRGLDTVTSDFVAWLDGDDRLPEGYLQSALQSLAAFPAAGYAYPDIQEFGARTELRPMPEWDRDRLLRENFVVPGAVFRTAAISSTRFDGHLAALEDWDFVLALVERGIQGVHTPVAYGYRRFEHRVSRSDRNARRVLRSIALHAQIQWCHRTVVPLWVIVSSGIVRVLETMRAKFRAVAARLAAWRQPRETLR